MASPPSVKRLLSRTKLLTKQVFSSGFQACFRGLLNLNRAGGEVNEFLVRQIVTSQYLRGSGIEIGALDNPLPLPPSARVKYVDRMSVADLTTHYPELADTFLVEPDILDDGEHLKTIANESQDFVIANHFLEHCQNPIGAIAQMLRVLKPNGILYLCVPDKRFTFDRHRPTTDLEHILRDYREGAAWSKEQHFREWAKYCILGHTPEQTEVDQTQVEVATKHYLEMDYSIHFHAWTGVEILELANRLPDILGVPIEVEMLQRNVKEIILVLRKR